MLLQTPKLAVLRVLEIVRSCGAGVDARPFRAMISHGDSLARRPPRFGRKRPGTHLAVKKGLQCGLWFPSSLRLRCWDTRCWDAVGSTAMTLNRASDRWKQPARRSTIMTTPQRMMRLRTKNTQITIPGNCPVAITRTASFWLLGRKEWWTYRQP